MSLYRTRGYGDKSYLRKHFAEMRDAWTASADHRGKSFGFVTPAGISIKAEGAPYERGPKCWSLI